MGKGRDLAISYKPGLHTCAVYHSAADKSLFLVLFPRPAATGYYLAGDLSIKKTRNGSALGSYVNTEDKRDSTAIMQSELCFDFYFLEASDIVFPFYFSSNL